MKTKVVSNTINQFSFLLSTYTLFFQWNQTDLGF
jgi:hypothetical protein